MAIDRDTLILVTLIGGPLATISYIAYKGAEYLGPRVETKELLPNFSGQGRLLFPKFTVTKPEVARGLLEELKVVAEGGPTKLTR